MSISTSDQASATTLHNIEITLYDDSANQSEPLLVQNSSRDNKPLARGQTHVVELPCAVAMGPLSHLLVAMVRRKGVKAKDEMDSNSWHLKGITVKDLSNDQRCKIVFHLFNTYNVDIFGPVCLSQKFSYFPPFDFSDIF